MYPDVLPSADIDADGIVAISCVHPFVQLYMGLRLGAVAKSFWRNATAIEVYGYYCPSVCLFTTFSCFSAFAEEYHKIWRADISSRHLCRWILLSFNYLRPPSAPTGISVGHCVRPSVRPERHYHFNSLRISAVSLKFGGMMHSTMDQIARSEGWRYRSNGKVCRYQSEILWDHAQ